MKTQKSILLAVAVGLVVVAGAGYGGYAWWHGVQVARIAGESLPPRPDLSTLPVELRQRVEGCEQRVRRGPDRASALIELATLYHANSFYTEAVQCYQGVLQIDSNPRWAHRLASILSGFGDLERSAELWRYVVAEKPDYLPAQIRLGDVLLKADKIDAAASVYQVVLKYEDDNPYAQVGLARVAIDRDNWVEARTRLEKAAAKSNYQIGQDLLVTVYERLGQTSLARMLRGQHRAAGTFFDPPDPWVDEIYFDCYITYRLSLGAGAADRGGSPDVALQLWDRALSIDPHYVPVLYQLGMFYYRRNDQTKALSYFKQCTESDPTFPDGWAYVSFLLNQMGDRYNSELALAQGLKNCPNSPGLHLDRGRRRLADGRFAEALEEFDTNCRLRPEEGAGHLSAAQLYLKQEDVPNAIARLQQALQAEPGLVEAIVVLGACEIEVGNETEARRILQMAAEHPRISPKDMDQLRASFQKKFGKLL